MNKEEAIKEGCTQLDEMRHAIVANHMMLYHNAEQALQSDIWHNNRIAVTNIYHGVRASLANDADWGDVFVAMSQHERAIEKS